MLSNRDLYAEIEAIEKNIEVVDKFIADMDEGYEKIMLKIKKDELKTHTLNLKLLHNVRANMVTIMKHFKIELLKPQTKREADAGKEKPESEKAE